MELSLILSRVASLQGISAAPSPTAIRLKGVRSKPTACRRSFRLRWWSGWHRGVLREFAGGVWVLLALSAKRPCPQSKCRSMYMAALLDTSTQTGRCRTLPGLAISKINKQPRPVVLSPTIIRLKDLRIRPTACLRSSLLIWWSGWHRGVLRGFAGWGVVLLALLGRPPCPSSKCQDTRTRLV